MVIAFMNDGNKGGFYEHKTRLFKIGIQVLLTFAYIGYFFSLYRGIPRNILTYINYIIIIVCLSGCLFVKPEKESKILYVLTRVNCIVFIIWANCYGYAIDNMMTCSIKIRV